MEEQYPASAWRRLMRIHDVFGQAQRRTMTWHEAAEALGVDPRTVRRWKQTLREHDGDFATLRDGRKHRPSPRRVPECVRDHVKQLYRDQYREWNVKHFHEQLHKYQLPYSYTWTKQVLQEAGLVAKDRKRQTHRRKRERKPLPGMLLHIDGSDHAWIPTLAPVCVLVLMDDATSQVYYAKFVEEETTQACLAGLHHVIATEGLFCSLYSDRASHFFYTPTAGGKVDRSQPTQIGRALGELSIARIAAYSPEARGRSERLFGTWQGRLPNELAFHGITTLADANRYLWDVFIPWHNQHLTVGATSEGSAFTPYHGRDLDLVLSVKESRQVAADNTLAWHGQRLQLEPSAWRISFAKCTVMVHEHLDGTLSVVYGPHVIGRFDAPGQAIEQDLRAPGAAKHARSAQRSPTTQRTTHVLSTADILTCH